MISALLLVSCHSLAPNKSQTKINWRTLEQGKIEAAARQKPCLVDFYFGEQCHRCAMLEKQVYDNDRIASMINTKFIPVRIDLTRKLSPEEKALEDKMGSGGECMLLFLDQNGNVIKNQQGVPVCSMEMISPERFISYLDETLELLGQGAGE
ncbi:MAG: thioredoxin family protein [Proteobacteria bacterium]|nr:thioredoxin family protein [Pseudomonadota bacterium]MBU1714975.1 thioredoxin family protein [Pseudomonadota bacterium]